MRHSVCCGGMPLVAEAMQGPRRAWWAEWAAPKGPPAPEPVAVTQWMVQWSSEGGADDDVFELLDRILASDGFVSVTP